MEANTRFELAGCVEQVVRAGRRERGSVVVGHALKFEVGVGLRT